MQRKGARFATSNFSCRESVTFMLDTLQWPPLQGRRRARRLTHFYKATNSLSLVKIPKYVTASSGRTRTHVLIFVQLHNNYNLIFFMFIRFLAILLVKTIDSYLHELCTGVFNIAIFSNMTQRQGAPYRVARVTSL